MLNIDEKDIDRITEVFYRLLKGQQPPLISLPEDYPDNEVRQAVGYINRFLDEYNSFAESLSILSKGDLDFQTPKSRTATLHSLKNLQANLKHLTWKTQQVASGDFSHKVDFMGDFSAAFNKMVDQLKEAFERIEAQNKELAEAYEVIKKEKEKSDSLLLNILPARVADELKSTGKTVPESFRDVTVYFSDIVDFTANSSKLEPRLLIEELNDIFTAFDRIMEVHECERIKTIGDAYLAVCGLPVAVEDHAKRIVDAAREIVRYLQKRNRESEHQWDIRVGIHSGRVVGGVVGIKKYIYDVFGDAINTACRMESHSAPMRINVSEMTYEILKDTCPFIERETAFVKGKGEMRMYFVDM